MKTIKVSLLKKSLCLFVAVALLISTANSTVFAADFKGIRYPYVFVSGYGGYGQYDKMNESFQYWGMQSGDLLQYLNSQGFECYAASVDPVGSAWDRACELYAQLAGTVVDYGEVHSNRFGHERFGTDYSTNPLLTGWGNESSNVVSKINFIGHSFGGTTIRVLADLLANGSAEEVGGTTSGAVSGLFLGGKGDWVNSITTLSTPHNGSTVVDAYRVAKKIISWGDKKVVGIKNPTSIGLIDYVINLSKLFYNGIGKDTGIYALTLDGAAEINKNLSPLKNIYYFSFATDTTRPALFSKARLPDKHTDLIFLPMVLFMGSLTGVSPGGIVFEKSWFKNDGVVNTVSCLAPFNEAQKTFTPGDIKPGIWNIMPVFTGDHASIIGGVITASDIGNFYLSQMRMIDSL